MAALCCARYFKPAKAREENPAVSTLPWPPRPVGPEAHRENKAVSKEEGAHIQQKKRKSNYEVMFALIGYSIGIGSAWRLPYYAFRNGGGAFLLAYLIIAVVVGLPMVFLEIALGQYSSLSQVKVWRLCPIAKGIGYMGVLVVAFRLIYYPVLLVWSLYYMLGSLDSEVPWGTCGNFWNTPGCTTTSNATGMMYAETSPAEEFWLNRVLVISPTISEIGSLRWELLLLLILIWFIVILATIKGVRSFGKVDYVTATLPFITLFILLIRGATLPGAIDGVKYFVTPDWATFGKPKVWADATLHLIYSLGLGCGVYTNIGSYNKFHNNCQRDAIIILVTNVLTGIMAGFGVFCVLGFLAYETGKPLEAVTTSGLGLAFVSYSTGLAQMPLAPVWAVLFFLTMFSLGIDTIFGEVDAIVSVIISDIPKLKPKRWLVNLVLCIVIGTIGIIVVTQSGAYWVNLLEWHIGGYPLLIGLLFEVITVMFTYGYTRFADDIYTMLGAYPSWFWVITWNIITPISLTILLVVRIIGPQWTYFEGYTYPSWAESLGWAIAIICMLALPVTAVVVFFRTVTKKGFSFLDLVRPAGIWGPALNVHRHERGLPPIQQTQGLIQNEPEEDFYNYIPQHNRGQAAEKSEPRPELILAAAPVVDGPTPDLVPLTDNGIINPTFQRDTWYSRPPSYHTQGSQNSPLGLYPDLDLSPDIPTEVLMHQSPQTEFRIIETPHMGQNGGFNIPATGLSTQIAQPQHNVAPMTIPINLQLNLVPQGQGQQLQTTQPQTVNIPSPQPTVVQQPQLVQPVSQPTIPPITLPQSLRQNHSQPQPQAPQVFAIASSSIPPAVEQPVMFQSLPITNPNPVVPKPAVADEIYTTWQPTEPNFYPGNRPVMSPVTAFVSPPPGWGHAASPQVMSPVPPSSFTNFASLDQYRGVGNSHIVQTVPTNMITVTAGPSSRGYNLRPIYDSSKPLGQFVQVGNFRNAPRYLQGRGMFGNIV